MATVSTQVVATQRIPGLTGLQITDANGMATVQFTQFWQQAMNLIQAQITNIDSNVVNIQASLAAAAAAQATANNAQAAADAGGGTPSARSGSNTVTNLFVGADWTQGPLVPLLTVSAGNLTGSASFNTATTATSPISATGQYRIQQVIGVSETTVFTGNWIITSAQISFAPDPPRWLVTASDQSSAALAALNLSLATTGSIDYRLDFILSGAAFTLKSTYLFVRRS